MKLISQPKILDVTSRMGMSAGLAGRTREDHARGGAHDPRRLPSAERLHAIRSVRCRGAL